MTQDLCWTWPAARCGKRCFFTGPAEGPGLVQVGLAAKHAARAHLRFFRRPCIGQGLRWPCKDASGPEVSLIKGAHMHANHTDAHSHGHTDLQTSRHADIQAYRHIHILTYMQTAHTYTHTYIRPSIHTCTHTYITLHYITLHCIVLHYITI